MHIYVIYNPLAGHGDSEAAAKEAAAHFEGCVISYHNITEITDYAAFFAPISTEDKILLCGGDGTINRFINATDGLSLPCEILYFAIGTGNDFLNDLNKKAGCEPFALNDYMKDLPMVEVNGEKHRFLNGVGYGIDGYCCEVGDKMKATSDKPVNYTAIAIKGLLFHYKPANATVTVDGQSYSYKKVWIAASMKGRYYGGGMQVAPKQNRMNEDKTVTVVIMYGSGKLKTLMVFPSIFKGEHVKHTEMVAVHTGKEISVSFDRPTALQVDGETFLNVTNYRVSATAGVLAEV